MNPYSQKEMEEFLYPQHPIRCIITGTSECGESFFLTSLNLNIIIECEKIYIYSPSLHEGLYQKRNKCFSIYIPIHMIPNNLNEEGINKVTGEIFKKKDFQKSDIEI